MWLRSFFRNRSRTHRPRNSSPVDRATCCGRHRTLHLEPLEQRTLLNVSGGLQTNECGIGEKDAAYPPVGWDLAALSSEYRAYRDSGGEAEGFHPSNPLVRLVGQDVIVDAAASGTMAALQADLESLGATVTGTAGRTVSALVPLDAIDSLNSLSSFNSIRPSAYMTNAGKVTSQGDRSMWTDDVRQFLTLDGSGQTVGVLSDSYNALRTARQDVTSGDLPNQVNVLQDITGGSDEGRAMLQIIHDVAPGAGLAFATAFLGEAGFATNITRLRNAGAKVIVDDVGYLAEPFFQDGIVAQAVNNVVSNGAAYFSAAGNQARQSYESVFRPGQVYAAGAFSSAPGAPLFFGGTAHDFDPGPGVDNFQSFTLGAGDGMILSFQWDQPFFSVSGGTGSQNDIDIYVVDSANRVVAGGVAANTRGDPVELFWFGNTTGAAATYRLMLVKYAGPDPGYVKYVDFYGGMTNIAYATNSGTATGHPNAALGAGVGAADYHQTPRYGQNPPVLESFSSAGGTPILFDTAGNRITAVVRQTPRFVAPDGVDTTFFPPGSGQDSDGSGYPNFFGTSAAAPHAAALAALLFQAKPGLTPAGAYSAMSTTAVDMGAAGYDYDTGWGLVTGPAAVAATGALCTVTFTGTSGDDQLVVRRDASGNDQLLLGGALKFQFPLSNIAKIVVKGGGGSNDTLTVDYAGGDPLPAGGLSFSGSGTTSATLRVAGGSFTTVTDTLTGPGSGSITLGQAGPVNRTITYTNSSSVLLNVWSVSDLAFSLPAGLSSDAVVGDDVAGATSTSEIRGATFGNTAFTNPYNSLTVNLGGKGNTLHLEDMDNAFHPAGSAVAAPLTVRGGVGNDTFDIESTRCANGGGGYGGLLVDGGSGNDTVIINADNLAGINQFLGNTGNDQFVLNVTGDIGGGSLSIQGNDPGGNAASRDVLDIHDLGGAVRKLTFAFPTPASGDLTVTGFTTAIAVGTMETVRYAGDAANDDEVTVLGTMAADAVQVTPASSNSANVLLSGGLAGGSAGPDLVLSGFDRTAGLTIDGSQPTPPPPVRPGDVLRYEVDDPTQLTVAYSGPGAGKVTYPGAFDVNFRDIEGFPAYARPGGPYTIQEGGSLSLNGSKSICPDPSDPIVTYEWYLNNNLVPGSDAEVSLDWSKLAALGIDDGTSPTPSSNVVRLRVTTESGTYDEATATLNILNAPPTVGADNAAVTVNEGQTAVNSGTWSDVLPDRPNVTLQASVGTVTKQADGKWSWSYPTTDGPADSQTVTITGNDGESADNQQAISFTLMVSNLPPGLSVGSPSVTVGEGQTAVNSGAWSDVLPDRPNVTLQASVGTVTKQADGKWSWSYPTTDGPADSQMVTITGNDGELADNQQAINFDLVVNNLAPTITSIGGRADGVRGQPLWYTGQLTDFGIYDTHQATWDWGDYAERPGTISEAYGSGTVTDSHFYVDPGTYQITLRVVDNEGAGSEMTMTESVTITVSELQPDPIDPTKTALVVGGSPGDDTILFGCIGPPGTVQLAINSRIVASVPRPDSLIVFGQTGHDKVVVSRKINLPVSVFDGQGQAVTPGAGSPSAIGVYAGGDWRRDLNGNGVWDSPPDDLLRFGFQGATPVVGDWNGDGTTEVGIYANGAWWLDSDGNGVYDANDAFFYYGWQGATPVVGDWNGDGKDEVGVYNLGVWFRDVNGSRTWDGPDQQAITYYGWNGATPVPGDWNADGTDDVGVYNLGVWFRDVNGNNQWDSPDQAAIMYYGWDGPTPVVGDWNGDGKDEVGVYSLGAWLRDLNGNNQWDGPDQAAVAYFGWSGALPVVGKWTSSGSPLMAAAEPVTQEQNLHVLTQAELRPIIYEAIARWAAAGLPAHVIHCMAAVQFVVADLPGTELGLASGGTISLDDNAAGRGWFIDPTPRSNEEFLATPPGRQLQAIDRRAVDRIDLLTVVEHELGHVAGLSDLDFALPSLMSRSLAKGIRRLPGAREIDAVLAEGFPITC